jgi:hypothetical protein
LFLKALNAILYVDLAYELAACYSQFANENKIENTMFFQMSFKGKWATLILAILTNEQFLNVCEKLAIRWV